jgi:hypothetical protein
MTTANRTIKEAYIKTLSASTLILFDLSMMTTTYSEEMCKTWLIMAHASAQLLERSFNEYFDPDYDDTVKKATKELASTQKALEAELKVQQNTAATINSVAEFLSIVESILIIFAGARLHITFGAMPALNRLSLETD